jgi:hypothetical protein
MRKICFHLLPIFIFLFTASYFVSCSKKQTVEPVAPVPVVPPGNPDACLGKTIVVTATATNAVPCGAGGSVSVAATGSTGFTYKLTSTGTYQAGGTFANVAAGSYTVFAKDADGCEKTAAVAVGAAGAAGPLFTNVKNLMTAKCQSCHNNTVQNGGMNWQVDCNIVTNQVRIKVRAVDEGTMPTTGPLTIAEKTIITNWINAGGRYID